MQSRFYEMPDGAILDLGKIEHVSGTYSEFPGGCYIGGFVQFSTNTGYEYRLSSGHIDDRDRLIGQVDKVREKLIERWKSYTESKEE